MVRPLQQMMGRGKAPQVNVNINELATVICECKNPIFTKGMLCKVIPALASPTGQAGLVHIPVFICNNCGKAYMAEDLVNGPTLTAEDIQGQQPDFYKG